MAAHRGVKVVLAILVMSAMHARLADCYSSGAPAARCNDMFPGHGVGSQAVTLGGPNGGYTINPGTSSYELGKTYVMTLSGGSSTNAFRGFLCEARKGTQQISTFQGPIPSNAQQRTSTPCVNAVTHNSGVDKTSISFNWKVTDASVGTFRFVCTVVQVKATIFVQIPSNDITLTPATAATPTTQAPTMPAATLATGTTQAAGSTTSPQMPTSVTPSTPMASTAMPTTNTPVVITSAAGGTSQLVSATGCGSSKSCYRSPASCTPGTNCDYFYSQSPLGSDSVTIELSANTDGWIAVGFSTDRIMGNDDVMGCNVDSANTAQAFIKNMNNVGKSNVLDNTNDPAAFLTDRSFTYVNGILSCKFTRLLKTTAAASKDKDLSSSNKYYYLFGTDTGTSGRGPEDVGMPSQHKGIPSITSTQYSVVDTTIANLEAATVTPGLIKAHGFFMIFAWICLAGIGMFMPRFMKKAWATPEGDIALWFKFHRPLMITVWLATMIGFVLILSYKKGEWSTSSAHPSIGLVTFILCGIQPFMAAIRTKLSPTQRKVFNWAHRTVGLSAHALGAIAVYLGMDLLRESYGLSTTTLYIWAAWAAIEAVVWIGHEVKLLISPADSTEKINSDAGIRKALLIVYAFSSVALGLVMAILVAVHKADD